jgi:peroxiredoxin
MDKRRRRSLSSGSGRPRHGSRPADAGEWLLRRPTDAHSAKRPRTVTEGPIPRTRGVAYGTNPEHGFVAETDGLSELDEVFHVSPRTERQTPEPTPEPTPPVDAQRESGVAGDLLGMRLPALKLEWLPGQRLDVGRLGRAPLVIYCHPGAEPEDVQGDFEADFEGADPVCEAASADLAECRSFAERCLELGSMRHRVVGVSSQSARSILSLASHEALPHVLLSDDRLELADEMGLPTFEVDGVGHYERLTMIVRDGRVEKVFYPIPDPATHAAEVARWLRDERERPDRAGVAGPR